MYFAGDVGVKARRLCDVTYEAMMRGIAAVKPGARVGDIGHAIQTYVEAQRFSVVRDFSRPRPRPHLPRRAEHPALRPAPAPARC